MATNETAKHTKKRPRAPKKDGDDDIVEKRRTQNRISQQCSRERQTAYIRHMESFIESIQSSITDDDDSRYAKLLRANIKLLAEKRDLEDALFRFRQKMLSFGNMAITAAEDSIFHRFLDPASEYQSSTSPEAEAGHSSTTAGQERGHEQLTSTGLEEVIRHDAAGPNVADSAALVESQLLASGIPSVGLMGQLETTSSSLEQQQPSFYTTGINTPGVPPFPDVDTSSNNLHHQSLSNVTGSGLVASNFSQFFQPQIPIMLLHQPPPLVVNRAVIDNSTVFADQVCAAATKFLCQGTANMQSSPSTLGHAWPSKSLVEKVAATAIEVIGARAGLESYIYGVNFAMYLELVMRWRITNDSAYRIAIPEPFRPTPLQWASSSYPVVIDFINWPSIRDQMILLSSAIDLDAMCRDLVLNTVIELPQRCAAVSVHDLLFNCILPKTNSACLPGKKSMLYDDKWVYVGATPASPSVDTTSSSTEEALEEDIAKRIQLRNHRDCPSSDFEPDRQTQCFSKSAAYYKPPPRPNKSLSDAISLFGIDKIERWKLSRDFARKYPYMDCSSVVTAYETIPCPASLQGEDML